MLNTRWLETFVAVCEDGNLTRTAERLHMTQPGVSQHLKKLESQVGTPLVRRTGKRFSLTPAGEKLRDFGVSRRREEHRFLAGILADNPDAGMVSIACSGSFASLLYPQLLVHAKSRPGLILGLEAAPQAAILRGVKDGQFAIGVLHEDPGHPRIDAECIGREEICLVLPNDQSAVMPTFQALEARGFISHPDGESLANLLFEPNFSKEFVGGDRLKTRGHINQIGQILEPVAQGIGYSILPRSGVDTFANRQKVRTVRLPVPVYQELWLIRQKGRQIAKCNDVPCAIVKNIARSLATSG
ncbi:LysR family transcriptional regulator [Aliiruegeria sabulilitoris]|uniref:LysR family transcriptional regulator n=1 Tax=Aliiruegeria sabulilitoris TaxID=1510458 RepID=UPI0009E6C4FC|nr:LysR family transcriptional regulator [Aliiruegeria sabulilitoris]NDR55520.1 LysR family transcriptional regulator [Pseudoruegeria sp. M32A2M]